MIKRDYFFSCKIFKTSNESDGYITIYQHITQRSLFPDSVAALDYCVSKAKKHAECHGYNGVMSIVAFNRV